MTSNNPIICTMYATDSLACLHPSKVAMLCIPHAKSKPLYFEELFKSVRSNDGRKYINFTKTVMSCNVGPAWGNAHFAAST